MSDLNSREYAVLYALMSGENAEPVNELARRVETNPAEVGVVLDGLVEQHILQSTVSFHEGTSEFGEIVYLFPDNDHAQEVYAQILEENPHLESA